MVWMNFSLQEKELSIRRLRTIFGVKTETAERLLRLAEEKTPNADNENKKPADPEKDKEKKGLLQRKWLPDQERIVLQRPSLFF